MSETWIRPDTTSANLSEITPPGYKLYQQPRAACRGGGLGFFVKDGLDPSVVPTKTCTTFENFLLKITLHKESFYVLNLTMTIFPMSIPLMPFPTTFQLILPLISQPLQPKPRLLSPFVNTIKLIKTN